MRLIVNGEERTFAALDSVAGLVAALGLDPRKVAVERNLRSCPVRPTRARRSPRETGSRSCISSEAAEP